MFRHKKGFTLIELLVVISIIALLLSILMPSLGKVKRKARAVVCRANLRQWGLVFGLYVQDNDDKYYNAWTSGSIGHQWIDATRPYYQDPKICFCPEATKVATDILGSGQGIPNAGNMAWGRFPESDVRRGYGGMAGSYGINDWVGNPAEGFAFGPASRYWVTPSQKGSNNAPLFLDSSWLGGMPEDSNDPPDSGKGISAGGSGMLKRYCVDRHEGNINAVFVDFSVRKVSLKELWKLKWHREFDDDGYRGVWPEWMEKFKE